MLRLMKASEVIAALSKLSDEFGDLRVLVGDTEDEVDIVWYREDEETPYITGFAVGFDHAAHIRMVVAQSKPTPRSRS